MLADSQRLAAQRTDLAAVQPARAANPEHVHRMLQRRALIHAER